MSSLPSVFSSSGLIAVINPHERPDARLKISAAHVRLVQTAHSGVSRVSH